MPTATPTPATPRENLVTLLGGLWLTAGLFIDGYAHSNLIDETEDFFTPWHGVFYSGFAFAAAWIGWLVYKRQNADGLRSWIPVDYGWAVAGVGVFAIGGLGDMIWHTIFGVESNIDALLSPTHMLLLLGLILILATPARSASRGSSRQPWIATLSVISLASLAAFFTTFARPISNSWFLSLPYDPPSEQRWEDHIALAVAGGLLTTVIIVASTIYLVQRVANLPAGAITALWAVPTVLEAIGLSNDWAPALVAATAGGVVADVGYRGIKGSPRRRLLGPVSAGVGMMWLMWTIANHLFVVDIGWPPEVWGGLIIMSMFVAAGLVLLSTPDPAAGNEPGENTPATRHKVLAAD